MFPNVICLLILQLVIVTSTGYSLGKIENNENREDLNDSDKLHDIPVQILEQLVKTDREAYLIWNITKQYETFHSDDINETCVNELQKDNKLIPFYIVNITLEHSRMLLLHYTQPYFWFNRHVEMSYVQALYENTSKFLSDQELYLSTVENVIGDLLDKEDANICVTNLFCGCISKWNLNAYKSLWPDYKDGIKQLYEFIVFGLYVEPFFRVIIIIIGMILNSTVLFIFIKEKSMRTESNILIFNLIISNIFMLLVYIPSNYISIYENKDDGHEYIAIEVLAVSANALTILFLNIQRYFEVSRLLNTDDQRCVSRPICRCIMYLVVLWTWSIVAAIFHGILDTLYGQISEFLLYLVIYVFVFSIVLSVFNSMTARKLLRAAKEGRTSTEFQHTLGSGLVMYLTVAYYCTHVLFYIYRLLAFTLVDELTLTRITITLRIIVFFLYLAFFSYCYINIIILYKASGVYRYFFNKYLFCCWYNPDESRPIYVTMSSVRNIEPEE